MLIGGIGILCGGYAGSLAEHSGEIMRGGKAGLFRDLTEIEFTL